MMAKKSSKEKILEAAKLLFAGNGFKGTSIRMIAEAAKVNVASINYYFSNKETLFYEVIVSEGIGLGKEFTKAHEESDDFVSMAVTLFKRLLRRPEQITSAMKLLLSIERLPDDGKALTSEQRQLISLGDNLFEKKIEAEIGKGVSEASLTWVAETMKSLILQTVLFGSSEFLKKIFPKEKFDEDYMTGRIERLARALLRDLKEELK